MDVLQETARPHHRFVTRRGQAAVEGERVLLVDVHDVVVLPAQVLRELTAQQTARRLAHQGIPEAVEPGVGTGMDDEAAARPQHPLHLGQGMLYLVGVEVFVDVHQEDGVEAAVGEVQPLGVGEEEFRPLPQLFVQGGQALAGKLYGGPGVIDAHGGRAAPRRLAYQLAAAAPDIQNPFAAQFSRGIQRHPYALGQPLRPPQEEIVSLAVGGEILTRIQLRRDRYRFIVFIARHTHHPARA